MDSALDFGSSGCGFESHQDRVASMAQRIAHRTSNPGVAGSNPAEDRRSHTHSPDMDWKII